MKRVVGSILAGLVLLFTVAGIAHASVNDFRFTSMDADYYLGSDSSGRSTLKTVEKLTAEFPSGDQNHGIERTIPKSYDAHTTSLKIESVTDSTGRELEYTAYSSGDNEVLRIGNADTYVHGIKEYVITYSQRDVARSFADTHDNEFYWDINGTQWAQAFGRVTARIHLSDSIKPTFTKNIACYQGAVGSTQKCDISTDGTVVTAQANDLQPYQNMTVAIGFTLGTFRGYEPSLLDIIAGFWVTSLIFTSLFGVVTIVWLVIRYNKINNRTNELKPIVPEYIPPKDVSVLLSAQIGDGARAETTAQLIDLAVRHYVTIAQTKDKSLWSPAEYEIEIVKSTNDLLTEERDFISTLFGNTSVGSKLQTQSLKNNYVVSSKLQRSNQTLGKRIKADYGMRANDKVASNTFKRTGLVLLVVTVITWSPVVLIAALVAFIFKWTVCPLTDKGIALRRYLAGLKLYIEVAEKDRIKMLQSPEGAEKTGFTVKDGSDKRLITLYERVLPYAVLFGQEKEWNKQLALQYETAGSSPDWYVGQSAFNAALFTSSLNDFSSSMNSYGASSSSSSGGSSGGGSSGGGGGGGGGGGW
ncbi:MAG: hypothetical protein JWN75_465 [Candidatus Saccharibacteria bacterium]|nr:hypothetical protein [Candidatus Saccharibacteria bacterium]